MYDYSLAYYAADSRIPALTQGGVNVPCEYYYAYDLRYRAININ